MKKLIPFGVIAVLALTFFSCSHKSEPTPVVDEDTTLTSSLMVSMYPETEAKYNLTSRYLKDIAESEGSLSTPFTITKQTKSIGGGSPQTSYQFYFKRDSVLSISFPIVTDSLNKQIYRYDSLYVHNFPSPTQLINFSFVGIPSTIFYQSDNLSLNITSYKNGKLSGNFVIRLTPIFNALDYNYRGSISLTSTFKNLNVIYQ